MTVFITSILVALSVSFLCSVMEAALLSITPSRLALIAEKSPRLGRLCAKFRDDVEQPVAVILILNTAAHTFGAAIAGAEFDRLFGSGRIWLFSLIFTLVMIQYTEILPKTLGVRFNAPVLRATAPALAFFIRLLAPLIWLVRLANRPFAGQPAASAGSDGTLQEIGALAAAARRASQLSETQEQIIRNTPALADRPIGELMLPLTKCCVIPDNLSNEEVRQYVRGQLHTRYPVCRADDPQMILGCLNVKDLLADRRNWRDAIRPVTFVDLAIPQLELIENILKFDSKLLIVRDHRQKALGMLTVNDVVMELLGKEYPAAQRPAAA